MNVLRHRLLPVLATVGLAAGLLVAAASPAHARRLPTCLGLSDLHSPDGAVFVHVPTTDHFSGDINCVLGVGSVTDAVFDLQTTLNYCYGADLDRDGKYGPLTRAAVIKAQRASHVRDDGTYGPVTARAMNQIYWVSDGPPPLGCDRAWWLEGGVF